MSVELTELKQSLTEFLLANHTKQDKNNFFVKLILMTLKNNSLMTLEITFSNLK